MPAAPHDSVAEVRAKERKIRSRHNIPDSEPVVLLEIELRDPSMFAEPLEVRGRELSGERVLAVRAVSVANAIAVISLAMQRDTGLRPTVYFEWSPGGPLREALRFVFLGRGQVATVTHEILRRAVPDESVRPEIHVA